MTYADAFADMMSDGTNSLWKHISAMPADKISWKPEGARSARELLEELVNTTNYVTAVIDTRQAEAGDWKDLAAEDLAGLEKLYRTEADALCKAVATISDEDFAVRYDLPWGNLSLFQVCNYAYWNLMYHLGQIAYIQTMYGDKEMY